MRNRILQKSITILFSIFSVVSLCLGIILFITSFHNMDDPTINPFPATIIAIGLILLPITMLLISKTYRSYQNLNAKYGLPDMPARPLLLTGISIILLTLIVVILAIYLFLPS